MVSSLKERKVSSASIEYLIHKEKKNIDCEDQNSCCSYSDSDVDSVDSEKMNYTFSEFENFNYISEEEYIINKENSSHCSLLYSSQKRNDYHERFCSNFNSLQHKDLNSSSSSSSNYISSENKKDSSQYTYNDESFFCKKISFSDNSPPLAATAKVAHQQVDQKFIRKESLFQNIQMPLTPPPLSFKDFMDFDYNQNKNYLKNSTNNNNGMLSPVSPLQFFNSQEATMLPSMKIPCDDNILQKNQISLTNLSKSSENKLPQHFDKNYWTSAVHSPIFFPCSGGSEISKFTTGTFSTHTKCCNKIKSNKISRTVDDDHDHVWPHDKKIFFKNIHETFKPINYDLSSSKYNNLTTYDEEIYESSPSPNYFNKYYTIQHEKFNLDFLCCKPFICPYCRKSFWRKFDCKRHLQTHTKDRPHECMTCGKSFARKDALKRHLSRVAPCQKL